MSKDVHRSVARVYNDGAVDYARRHADLSTHVKDFVDLLPDGSRVLEVGFGSGADANYLSRPSLNGGKHFNVIGVDLADRMVRNARRRYSHIRFEQGDMTHLRFGDGSFDGVYAEYSLTYVPKVLVSQALSEFSRVLTDDGILHLGYQEGESRETSVPAPFGRRKRRKPMFLNIMSREEIGGLLEQAGFEVVQDFVRSPAPGQIPFDKRVIHARKIGKAPSV